MDDKSHQEDGRKESDEVIVLAPQERDKFAGVTIEENGDGNEHKDDGQGERQYYRGSSGPRGYERTVSVGSGLSGIISWLVILGIIFFVLPAFFLFGAAIAVVWFVLKLFR